MTGHELFWQLHPELRIKCTTHTTNTNDLSSPHNNHYTQLGAAKKYMFFLTN